jgi:hypothetical protein
VGQFKKAQVGHFWRAPSELQVVLYSSSGKREDERRVMAHLDQIEERFKEMRLTHSPATNARVRTFRRKAILVQGFGTLAVVAVFANFWHRCFGLSSPFVTSDAHASEVILEN